MKGIKLLLVACASFLVFAACGNGQNQNEKENENQNNNEEINENQEEEKKEDEDEEDSKKELFYYLELKNEQKFNSKSNLKFKL